MLKLARALGVGLALFLGTLPLFSQGETGRISGSVTDQTGGAIAGATVTVTDVARGLSRPLMTDSAGQYTAPNLIPGMYSVRAESAGFKAFERPNVTVGVGGDIRVDISLQPGEQTQTVTVTADIPQMNTTSAQTGGTLENNLLQSLPINGGSYRSLTGVLPGVTKTPGGGVDDQSTNGGGTEWDNYMLDGLYDVSVYANVTTVGSTTSSGDTTLLPLDAIQEVNLIQNPKAEYGYYPGVTVDVGLKSGTNDVHGSAWAFGRGTSMNARNPFSATRSPFEMEQYGGVIGGPIKKNKMFYFAAYEGSRSNTSATFAQPTPTTAFGNGLDNKISFPVAIADINTRGFNSLLSPLSLNLAGCNPSNPAIKSTVVATVATACTANQFGSQTLFGNTSNAAKGIYVQNLPDFGHSNNGLIKWDYKINDHHSFNAEYYMGNSNQQLPTVTGNGSLSFIPTQAWWENVFEVYTRTGRVVEIWTPSSNWLNEARAGYDFQDQPNFNSECGNSTSVGHAGGPASYLTTYGFVSGADVVNGQQGCGFPALQISGITGGLDGTSIRQGGGRDLQFADVVSYTRGAHQFKWGVDFRKQCLCLESKNGNASMGSIMFGQTGFAAFTNATPLESFLAGQPSSESILFAPGSRRNIHYNLMALFLQDDWRVNSRLTLNLGVRWEGETPARDSGGQLGNFDPSAPSGMVQSNQLWGFQSSPSPHLGFAWDVTGKGTTVVRAGGSMAYVEQSMISWTSLANDSPQSLPTGATLFRPDGSTLQGPGNIVTFQSQKVPTTTNSIINGNFLPWQQGVAIFNASSFVTQCGNGLQIPGSAPAVFNPASCTLYGQYPSYKLPYVTTWNFSVQHAFLSNVTLNVAYVGTHGTDLNFEGDINQPTAGTAGSSELQRRPLYAQFPWFGKSVFNFQGGKSNYNGLQTTLAVRNYHGVTLNLGYTFSHALGPVGSAAANPQPSNINNLGAEYGNENIDFTHRFTLTTTYNIPGIKSPLQMLEGWSLASNVLIQSSPAITLVDGTFDTSGTGTKLDRWDMIGMASDLSALIGGNATLPCYGVAGSKFSPQAAGAAGACTSVASVALLPQSCQTEAALETGSPAGTTGTAAGPNGLNALASIGCYAGGPNNRSAITPPAQGTWGLMPPGALRNNASGGFKNWDLSLQKNWKLKERYTFQFRAEAFNVLNRTDFALPSLALGSPSSVGAASSTYDVSKGNPITGSGGPREVQLGLKILF